MMFLTPSQRLLDAARRALIARRLRSWRLPCLTAAGLVAVAAASAIPASREPDGTAFAAENDAAMAKMMKGMHVRSSGNVDRDFAVMMIAHHQGAIDMALAELRHGRNERLKRLANEIVVEQRQEITVMKAVLDEELPVSANRTRP
jgi:uncharacterized protein (DUF305 family)